MRYTSGSTPTDYGFTGQYSHQSDFGLMFYNARYYDSALGRFASPDTIVPEQSQGVQGLDRYAYTNNSPLNFVDPSGHWPCSGLSNCFSMVVTTVTNWAAKHPDTVKSLANYATYTIAEKFLPANAKGSQASLNYTNTVAALVVGKVTEINIVTSSKGELMVYGTNMGGPGESQPEKFPAIGSPQLGISVTTGPIYGDGFDSPEDFAGDGAQVWVGLSPAEGPSVTADIWSNTDLDVYGSDFGLSFGLSMPMSISGGVTGIYAERGSPKYQLTGVQLLICRLAYQCGRTPE